jgi:1-deoxy-D-xylulose-5-phosphate synthase
VAPGDECGEPADIPIGRAEVLHEGRDVQIWALGDMLPLAAQTAELLQEAGLNAGIVDPRFVSPLDHDLLRRQARDAAAFVTIENGVRSGGFGTGVGEFLAECGFLGAVLRFGWPEEFVPHGTVPDLMQRCGLVPEKLASAALRACRRAGRCPESDHGQGATRPAAGPARPGAHTGEGRAARACGPRVLG